MQIRSFAPADEDALILLWERCNLVRAWNDPHLDIARKCQHQPELLLVGLVDGKIVGSVMVGYEGHRGWINYLAVCPSHREQGFGRDLMAEAERCLSELGCPKVNLQVRGDNTAAVEFYQRIGYEIDDAVGLGKRLVLDHGPAPRSN